MNARSVSLKRTIGSAIAAVFIFAAAVGSVYVLLRLFQIKNIIVSGDPAKVEVNAKQFVGNMIFFQSDAVITQIKNDNPLIKTIEIRKHFPSTLELVVYKRQPIARLQTSTAIVGIDSEAIVTDVLGNDLAPVIQIDVPLVRMGQTIKDEGVKQAVEIIAGSQSFLHIRKIQNYETVSLQARTQESNIFFPQKGDIRPILDTLQTLIMGFRIKGTMPKTIDLRFDKPVVQF
ncbi:MAG: hypothetical protein WAV51_02560 [Microgenomates group bacterium]